MTRKLLAIVLVVFACAFVMGAAIHESIYHTNKLEIERQNPFLLERRGLIQPGDRITIEYIELDQ